MVDVWAKEHYDYEDLGIGPELKRVLRQRGEGMKFLFRLRHAEVWAKTEWSAKKIQTRWRRGE